MWRRFGLIRCCVMRWRVWCDGMVEVLWCWLMAINIKEIEIWNPSFQIDVSQSVCLWVSRVCEMCLWDVSVRCVCFLVISPTLSFLFAIFPFLKYSLSSPGHTQGGGSELGISVNHAWNWNLIPTWIIFSTKSFRGIWFRAPLAKRQKRVENELYRIWQPLNLLSLASSRIVLSEPSALSIGRREDGRVLVGSIKMRFGMVIQPIRTVDWVEGM